MAARRRVQLLVLMLLVWCRLTSPASAQDSGNILLVVNEASPESQRIAAHYAQVRGIPAAQTLRIKTSTADEISHELFVDEIERPIAFWLATNAAQDRILYIVLAKGIPLRVSGSNGPQGSVASVDSELAVLYRLLVGTSAATAGPLPNPYFLDAKNISTAVQFSHKDHDIFLVTRLDGFSTEDVVGVIDRGLTPAREGVFLLDGKGGLLDRGGDGWLQTAAGNLVAAGLKDRVVANSTAEVLGDRSGVLGYFSWGSNDPAIKKRDLNIRFVPGGLAATFVSTDARTFKAPPASWTTGDWNNPTTFFEGSPQSLTGDLIREGATGVAGNVAEPYLAGTIRPQILFPAYVAGFNLAESFYLSMPYISWQTVVIGDPLCAPFRSAVISKDVTTPSLDPETELPRFFSGRRLAVLTTLGVDPRAARLSLRAEARMARGDKAGAVESLEQATAIDPRLIVDQFMLAGRYLEGGDFDKSVDRYQKILATAPEEMRSANNLAYTLAVNKDSPAEGLPLAEKAYKLSKATPPKSVAESLGNASIADTLGWVHFLLGHTAEAEKYLNEAVKNAPNNPEIHLHLAQLYAQTNRSQEAIVELNKMVAIDAGQEQRNEVVKLRALLSPNQPPAKPAK